MRWWIGLAAGLYPRSWRQRYGVEFQALLEDLNPDWQEFADVLRGAVKMQMTNAAAYLKLAGGLALVGAIAATAASFSLPRIYESAAEMRMEEPGHAVSADVLQGQVAHQLNEMEQEILSRTNLEGLITRPDLDLYKEERSRLTMEDVVRNMRHDIKILMAGYSPEAPRANGAFTVSFLYPNQQKAQAVVRALTAQFIQQNLQQGLFQERVWRDIMAAIGAPARAES